MKVSVHGAVCSPELHMGMPHLCSDGAFTHLYSEGFLVEGGCLTVRSVG